MKAIRFGSATAISARLRKRAPYLPSVTAWERVRKAILRRTPLPVLTLSVAPQVTSVTNPFAGAGGADQETNGAVHHLAPQAFRAVQYRAVRPEDYVAAAETLSWVERAGTVFRWTGNWLSVFTTADPLGSDRSRLRKSWI